MAEITLHATIRQELGRSKSNEYRREGMVPGIFYQRNRENIAFVVKSLDLRPLVYSAESHLVRLKLDNGTQEMCIMREVQWDPVKDVVTHIDLQGLVMDQKMRFEVGVVLTGTPQGVREGGLMQQVMHKVEIECLPNELPEHFSVDVSAMGLGQVLTVGDLPKGNYEFMSELEQPVVTITHPRDESAESDEERPAEPEVIARGKAADED